MSGVQHTGTISIDQNGDVWEYVPPNLVKIASKSEVSVSYGPPQQLIPGDALPPGIWKVVGAGLEAVGEVEVQSVTIT